MLCQALLPAIACSLTQASRVAVAMTFSVVFAFLLQAIFEGTSPTIYAIGGKSQMLRVDIDEVSEMVHKISENSDKQSSESAR